MTKDKAIHAFFSSFGLTAYPANNVPDDTAFPWLTYEMSVSGFAGASQITVHLYFYTTSEAIPNDKAEEICGALRRGGRIVSYDGGAVWITLGDPEWFAQPDQGDRCIKHRIINMTLQYLT